MDMIFKQYGVCEDVADMIAKKVHIGFQSKLNDHISVIIAWDGCFDYWKFGGNRTSNLFFPSLIHNDSNLTCSTQENFVYREFRRRLCDMGKKKKNYSKKISKSEYLSYVFSNKKVFMIARPIRWNQLISALDTKYKAWDDNDTETEVSTMKSLSSYVLPMTLHVTDSFLNELGLIETDRVWDNMIHKYISTEVFDPITWALIIKTNILKKELISYLNRNGNPRKLTNKTKKELWKMIFEMKC